MGSEGLRADEGLTMRPWDLRPVAASWKVFIPRLILTLGYPLPECNSEQASFSLSLPLFLSVFNHSSPDKMNQQDLSQIMRANSLGRLIIPRSAIHKLETQDS